MHTIDIVALAEIRRELRAIAQNETQEFGEVSYLNAALINSCDAMINYIHDHEDESFKCFKRAAEQSQNALNQPCVCEISSELNWSH